MSRYFFDSSALAKRYHRETGTEKVALRFDEPGREIRISRLSFVEVQSVFAMKVSAGFISLAEAGQQRARLVVDVAAGQIEVYAVTPTPSSLLLHSTSRGKISLSILLCPTRHWARWPREKACLC